MGFNVYGFLLKELRVRCATGGGRPWQLVGRAQFRRAFGIIVPGAKQLLNPKPSECAAFCFASPHADDVKLALHRW